MSRLRGEPTPIHGERLPVTDYDWPLDDVLQLRGKLELSRGGLTFLICQNVVGPKRFKLTTVGQCTLGSFDRRPFDECKNVCIDDVGMSRHHAVGKAGVDFQRTMLEQLGLQQ